MCHLFPHVQTPFFPFDSFAFQPLFTILSTYSDNYKSFVSPLTFCSSQLLPLRSSPPFLFSACLIRWEKTRLVNSVQYSRCPLRTCCQTVSVLRCLRLCTWTSFSISLWLALFLSLRLDSQGSGSRGWHDSILLAGGWKSGEEKSVCFRDLRGSVYRQVDRQTGGLYIMIYCPPSSILFTILNAPGWALGDCSHGIPTLYDRVSYSDWFSLPLMGHVLDLRWYWYGSVAMLFVCLCFLSLLCFGTEQLLSDFFFVHSQRQRQRQTVTEWWGRAGDWELSARCVWMCGETDVY